MKPVGRWWGLVPLAFCVVLGWGCGKSGPKLVPVSGIVVNGDKPVPAAMVQFSADVPGTGKEEGWDAYAHTDAQGNFTLRTMPHGDGAALGRYKVVITCYDGPGARLIPRKFADRGTTTLNVEVKEGGLQDLKLDLSK
jgi:hypothetical protein